MLSLSSCSDSIVLLGFAIDEAHVVQMRAADDHGDLGRAGFLIVHSSSASVSGCAHDPVALAIGPELQQDVGVVQFE